MALHDEAKAAVLAAIRAGHSIRSIDQEELGLPDKSTINLWLNIDLAFASAFAQAEKDRGPSSSREQQRYNNGPRIFGVMTPRVCEEILALVDGGNTLHEALQAEGLPDQKTVREYTATDPEFARRLDEARKRVGAGTLHAESRRAGTVKRYLEAFPDLIASVEAGGGAKAFMNSKRFSVDNFGRFLKTRPDLRKRYVEALEVRDGPGRGGWIRYTDEQYRQACDAFSLATKIRARDFKAEGLPNYQRMLIRSYRDPAVAELLRAARRTRISGMFKGGVALQRASFVFTEELRERVLTLLASGFKLPEILKWKGMPGLGTVKRYRNLIPEYDRRFREARKVGRPKVLTAAPQVANKATTLKERLLQDQLYSAANNAVPQWLDDRDDIITDIVEAVIFGDLGFDEIEDRADEYESAHLARFSSRKFESLDERLFEDGEMTRGDRLTTDDYSFAD
jgi:hypothetical protein